MVKLVSAKCPSCGAALKLSNDEEKTKCEYCQQTIIIDDAIACYKLKISGKISVKGIETNTELIDAANKLLDMNEFLKAKRKFLEFSEKCPDKYQGWLGLLICRTRNFTIKDNNIMFENDVNKFYKHFLKVAPEEVKKDYVTAIENYLHPEIKQQTQEQFNFKLDLKLKPFIAPLILIICGISLLSIEFVVGGLMLTLTGIILIPKVKEKLKLSKKKIDNYLHSKNKPRSKKQFNFKPRFKSFIAPLILIICGISLLSIEFVVGGLMLTLTGVILIPKVKEKLKLSKKKSVIISIVLGFFSIIAIAVEAPYSFVGKWESLDNSYTIELKEDNTFILKTNEGENISGTFSNTYENEEYTITLSSENDNYNNIVYKYYSNADNFEKLCLYENQTCKIYYKEILE